MYLLIFLLLTSIMFAVARFTLPSEEWIFKYTFKNMAHIWDGILIAAAVCNRSLEIWFILGGLIAVEVIAAIVRKPK